MKLNFEDMWSPPYPEEHAKAGGGSLYRKLNGIPAEIFMIASYEVTSLPSPEIKCKWLDFVGGFTDEYFFNKEEIEKLSDKDRQVLLDFIKKQKQANSR